MKWAETESVQATRLDPNLLLRFVRSIARHFTAEPLTGRTSTSLNMLQSVAIASMLVIQWSQASAAIDVCGLIGGGEIWSIADSPVNVTCDLDIAELTVEAGVEVHVSGDYEIVVSGILLASGTREFPVVFKPSEQNAAGWGGFFFEDAIAGSEFLWSRIEGSNSSGVHLVRSNPTFDNVTFENNSATHGGAIYAEVLDSDLQVSNSFFLNNFADVAGGAIYFVGPAGLGDAALAVTESVFLQNSAGSASGTRNNTWGGAIYSDGNSRILRSSFQENQAAAFTIFALGGRFARGGAIFSTRGHSEIEASTFIGNACRLSADSQTPDASRAHGGALYLDSGDLLLKNSLLAENDLFGGRIPDHRGGGIYVAGGNSSIINSTLANNDGHALYHVGGNVETLNSILFFNNNGGEQIAGTVTATFSDIQNGFTGNGNIDLNPIFTEQFAIVDPSPAIDAGNPSPQYDDIFPPGLGGARNDMGLTGGMSAGHWNSPVCYRDSDGDGFGDADNYAHMVSCSFDYVADNNDCDDTDPSIFPGSGESCTIVAPTGKCGLIGGGEIWSIADSPVNVTCDLDIAELTVEAGVEVHVSGDYEIVVSGILLASGTREFPVVFKPSEQNAAGWGGFFFEDAIAGSEFLWSRIEGSNSSGVHLVRSNPTFDNVTFENNSATHGGAIYAEVLDSDLQVSNSFFLNNFADVAGGAIYFVGPAGLGDAALAVTESVFLQNSAGSASGTRNNTWGGAIYSDGNSRILRSSFQENQAAAFTIFALGGRFARGGAIFSTRGHSEIEASTFIGNACRLSADSQTPDASRAHGGALYLDSGDLLLKNSLLAENDLFGGRIPDHRGGGIYVAGGNSSIINSTLANNDGHALYHVGGNVETLNSILFFNNNGGEQIAGTVTATFSDIQNGFTGNGNIDLNPIFTEQFAIVDPSPAIDAGNPSPQYDDIFPPGLGGARNDMGFTGGPGAVFSAIADAGPDQVVDEQSIVTLDGRGSSGSDGDSFTYAWRQILGPSVNLSSAIDAQPTFLAPTASTPTTLTFELVVNDGIVDSAPDTVEITVNHVNRAPNANASADQDVEERVAVTLDSSGSSDPDGDALTYIWSQVFGPTVTLSSTTVAQPTFVAPDVLTDTMLTFELVVNDGEFDSVADAVDISVRDIPPPPPPPSPAPPQAPSNGGGATGLWFLAILLGISIRPRLRMKFARSGMMG